MTTRARRGTALACGIAVSALSLTTWGASPSGAEETTSWCGTPQSAPAKASAPTTTAAGTVNSTHRATTQKAMAKALQSGRRASSKATARGFATWEKPYAADSLWNSAPVNPVLGSYQIPDTATGWWATAGGGDYGIGIQKATAADPSQLIGPLASEQGIWNATGEQLQPTLTLPHFPAGTLPPKGTDGAVAILDQATGVVWSFWQLRHDLDTGAWCAKQVSVARIDGPGWGTPADAHTGASAAGQSQLAGLIREEEFNDVAAPMYRHALTATLDNTGLLAGTSYLDGAGKTQWTVAYQFPATSGDGWGDRPSGQIPEGALLMLPKDYPVDKLPSRELRKIARTLQVYGAYVVDRNWGVPLTIGAANGYSYQLGDEPYDDPTLDDSGDWAKFEASGVGQAMDEIRRHVRMVVAADGYTTGAGRTITPRPGWGVNLLNLHDATSTPWVRTAGSGALPSYDAATQRLLLPDAGVRATRTGDWQQVDWARLHPGERARLQVTSSRGARYRLTIQCDRTVSVDSGWLGNGSRATIEWPACANPLPAAMVDSGKGRGWVAVDLRRV